MASDQRDAMDTTESGPFHSTCNDSATATQQEYPEAPAPLRQSEPGPSLKIDESIAKDLNDLNRALDSARAENIKYKSLLDQANTKIQELEKDLDEEIASTEEVTAFWKQSAADLNTHLVHDRGFKPLDDRVFIDMVSRLRRDVRDFAFQYFNSDSVHIKPSSGSFKPLVDSLQLGPDAMYKVVNMSSLVRACIWKQFDEHVFGRFTWSEDHRAMCSLTESLKATTEEPLLPGEQERERQFWLWRARTSTLLQGNKSNGENKKGNESRERKIDRLTNDLAELLPQLTKKQLSKAIGPIWADAVKLDIVMSTQASGLELYYGDHESGPIHLDHSIMEVESENVELRDGKLVGLILAPALRRTRDPNGGQMPSREYLLKMLVSCNDLDVRTRDPRQEEKGQIDSSGSRTRDVLLGFMRRR